MKYINPDLSLPEILNILEKSDNTITEKANMLKFYWPRKDVKFFIDFLYNGDQTRSKIIGELPVYIPSTKPNGCNFKTLISSLTALESCIRYLHQPNYDKNKFDNMLKNVLEYVSATEAELVIRMFSGKKYRGAMKTIFKEAYPEFFRTNIED